MAAKSEPQLHELAHGHPQLAQYDRLHRPFTEDFKCPRQRAYPFSGLPGKLAMRNPVKFEEYVR
jgi:hypothetical protein